MDLEREAVKRIQAASEMSLAYYKKPLVCTYSGGKDSEVLLELFQRSGVPFEVQHNHTTVDAPHTVRHIRGKFQELEQKGISSTISKPAMSMWQLIPHEKMPPTRLLKYCCRYFKEGCCRNRMIATGVRWAESTQRRSRGTVEAIGKTKKEGILLPETGGSVPPILAAIAPEESQIMLANDKDRRRRFFEHCTLKAQTVCNPIINWSDAEVWDYVGSEKIRVNPLYFEGFHRIGCIGCPSSGKSRYFEFQKFPAYQGAYTRAFQNMLVERRRAGKETKWKSGGEVFSWWMEEEQQIEGQLELDFGRL